MKTKSRNGSISGSGRWIFFLLEGAALSIATMLLAGCALIMSPATLFQVGVEAALINKTGRTSSEHVASQVTRKDCYWPRILDNEPACMTWEDRQIYIRSKNCKTYTFNWLGLPRCAEDQY